MKLHYRAFGEGKPLIILHGLFGSSDNWQTFAKQMAGSGYAIYTVDLRNHGLSPHAEEFDYTGMSADIDEMATYLGFSNFVLLGHSLGGKTAMTYAMQHEEKLRGLVVIDIAPRQYPSQNGDVLKALQAVDFTKTTTRKDVESSLNESLHEPSTIQFLMKNLYWKEKDQLSWRFNLDAISRQFDIVGKPTIPPKKVHVPSLFVKGEKSDYITYEDEREIYDLFDNVDVQTAPGAGHWVHADNLPWLLENVKTFLEKLP